MGEGRSGGHGATVSYREFFERLTGFPPHPYQERLADEVLNGKSIIMRLPTGGGKTWAAVAPFLYALSNRRPLADRLLYALPLRSLASSLHATVFERMSGCFGNVLEMGKDRDYANRARYCSLQIGSQKNDPFFESDLIFTTIDQLLSAYVFIPVSLPDRLGNINAGALIGSLVIFDEVHLLDPAVALGTMIEMLDRLRGLSQVLLMTATMSDPAMSFLTRKVGASAFAVPDAEIRALPSQKNKQRTWRWSSEPLNAASIKAQHCDGRTIVLVNSVSRAQDLVRELEGLYSKEANRPELILLHSRFYPEDRKAIEDRLDGFFGSKAMPTNIILVTTQVIEAGIDISAECLHTELAPMNALIQRAGRTARYMDRNTGMVTVYEVTTLGPYRENKSLIDATRGVLQQLPLEGRSVDFIEERQWVEAVHSVSELQQLARYSNLFSRRKEVHEAMDQGHRGKLTQLVRDIDSVGVLIAEQPEHLDFNRRAWPRLLSVPGISLMRLRDRFRYLMPGQWVAKGAVEDSNDEQPGLTLSWKALLPEELRFQWLVALNPDFASYDPRLGLVLGRGGPPPPVELVELPTMPRYQYQFETWKDHSQRIVAQVREGRSAHARAIELLSRRYSVPSELIEQLVEITCALHDTGKLTLDWQQRAWHWQDDKDSRMRAGGAAVPVRLRVPIAHTWFDSAADREAQRKPEYKFPPHSVQGAIAVADAFEKQLMRSAGVDRGQMFAACAYTAIARHHGPRTKEGTIFRLCPDAAQVVSASLPEGWRELPLGNCGSLSAINEWSDTLLTIGHENDEPAWPLYAFLVRRLRLADQAAVSGLGGKKTQKNTPL
jgi:CRISPR-associated endonuclease/helicase Cas3